MLEPLRLRDMESIERQFKENGRVNRYGEANSGSTRDSLSAKLYYHYYLNHGWDLYTAHPSGSVAEVEVLSVGAIAAALDWMQSDPAVYGTLVSGTYTVQNGVSSNQVKEWRRALGFPNGNAPLPAGTNVRLYGSNDMVVEGELLGDGVTAAPNAGAVMLLSSLYLPESDSDECLEFHLGMLRVLSTERDSIIWASGGIFTYELMEQLIDDVRLPPFAFSSLLPPPPFLRSSLSPPLPSPLPSPLTYPLSLSCFFSRARFLLLSLALALSLSLFLSLSNSLSFRLAVLTSLARSERTCVRTCLCVYPHRLLSVAPCTTRVYLMALPACD